MKLKIRNVGPNDFGFYRCVAKNSLGKDGTVLLSIFLLTLTFFFSSLIFSCSGETDGMIKLDGKSELLNSKV